MPNRHRAQVSQGETVVTIREGETPVIVFPLFGRTTAAMTANFLRSGSPSVQILLSMDVSVLPGTAERVIDSITSLALDGEVFDFTVDRGVALVTRRVIQTGF